MWGFSQLLLSMGAKKLVIECIYVSQLKSTHASEFVTCAHSIAFGAFFFKYLISLAIYQGFYLNILAQSGLLLSSACQKIHSSLLLLVPKTLSSLLAWMGGKASVCVLLIPSYQAMRACIFLQPEVLKMQCYEPENLHLFIVHIFPSSLPCSLIHCFFFLYQLL